MCCGSRQQSNTLNVKESGLVEGHAYTIVLFIINFSLMFSSNLTR